MHTNLYVFSIRYLNSLYKAGRLSPKNIERLAEFTLELGKEHKPISENIETRVLSFPIPEDTISYMSDFLENAT
jgi:hypothetical protein